MNMQINNLVWKIGGEAGFGIMSSGTIFAKACMRQGLNIADFVEYPSLIRGGHNTYIVRASEDEIFAPNQEVDLLVALNKETIALHECELTAKGGIVYDNETVKEPGFTRDDLVRFPVPILRLAKENGGEPVMMNGVAIGVSLAILGADFHYLSDIFDEIFGRKGKEVVELNVKVAKAGYDYAKEHFKEEFGWQIRKVEVKEKHMLLSGTEAVSMGAFKAGCKFFAAYPMTPITNIIAYMAAHDEAFGFIYKQPEDEIAAVNMALGASFAGVRSMTATSGGGFALMSETVGLAGMTETPLVIINGMRPGPATGMPTWTGQADLRFVLHAPQDEIPRFILAPGDPKEAFELAFHAFNLADKYQAPVILLTDKNLNESHWSVPLFDTKGMRVERGKLLSDEAALEIGDDYMRYRFTADGVSPRKHPGQPGRPFLGASDEHQENSLFNEEAANRVKMMNKRMKKMQTALVDIPQPILYGPKEASMTIIAFGSTKGAIRDALKTINAEVPVANYLHYSYIWPLQTEALETIAKKGNRLILFEGNYSGQFAGLLYEHSGISVPRVVLKYDGRQFFPEEIVEQVRVYEQTSPSDADVELVTLGGEDTHSWVDITHAAQPKAANVHTQSLETVGKDDI